MPELPEVETVRRQLSRRIPGRMILRVEVHDPLCVAPADPEELRVLEGREVRRVARRGKHLLIHLDDGAALVVHLRMTGRLLWHAPGRADDADRFLRAVVALDDGSRLAFADQRRFVFRQSGDDRLGRLLAQLLGDLGRAFGVELGDVTGIGIGAAAGGDGGFKSFERSGLIHCASAMRRDAGVVNPLAGVWRPSGVQEERLQPQATAAPAYRVRELRPASRWQKRDQRTTGRLWLPPARS